jgi:cytochrome c biogenesis protein CcdA
MLQVLLTIYAGFTHAFEADHLLAVSNIVSKRNHIKEAARDGIFWGLGHTSTILLVGILVIIARMQIAATTFQYFEAIVGLMLITLAIFRLIQLYKRTKLDASKAITHTHTPQGYFLAFGVGLVHGLAGSGSLIVLVLSQINHPLQGLIYLLIFGFGSVAGMLLAAGLFSIPFSKKIIQSIRLQTTLVLISASLCIIYGGKVVWENLAP